MPYLEVLDRENAPDGSKEIFDSIKNEIGMLPNLYAVIGHSPTALSAELEFADKLSNGEFSEKEVQAIYLAASEVNRCGYCASAHTLVGKDLGFTDEETKQLRLGEIDDDGLRALTRLTREIVETRGKPGDEYVQNFFNAGYSKAAFVELHGLIAIKTFTNYLNHVVGTPIDFPEAESLENELV